MALISKSLFWLIVLNSSKLSLSTWPESVSISQICNKCDCEEPNINCFDKNITTLDKTIIPDETAEVNFSRNFVQDVPCNLSWPLSVIEIDLSRNVISNLPTCAFKQFHLLESLNLSHNKLVSLKPKQFFNFSNLSHLDLSNNGLQVLGNLFNERNGLIRLSLANNPLGKNLLEPKHQCYLGTYSYY